MKNSRGYRVQTTTRKVQTEFGSMYIHINYNRDGSTHSGNISHPGKEPTSQIAKLVGDLSIGLNDALDEGRDNTDDEKETDHD